MFTKIRLKNFYLFHDVVFDLTDSKMGFSPLAVIYGENGSGKTKLLSCFSLFIDLLKTMEVRDTIERFFYEIDIHKEKPDIPLPSLSHEKIFQMLRSSDRLFHDCRMIGSNEPVYLEYEFIINGKKGSYSIEFSEDGILEEHLEYTLEKRKGLYFHLSSSEKNRVNPTIIPNKDLFNDLQIEIEKFWGKHTFLAIIIHEMHDKAPEYIKRGFSENFLTLLSSFQNVSCAFNLGPEQHNFRSDAIDHFLVTSIEQGIIEKSKLQDLDRTEKILNGLFKPINSDNRKLYFKKTPAKDESYIKYELMIVKMIAGKERELPFSCESYGNHQIVKMLPFFWHAFHGGVVVLDESDAGIHDLLYLKMIKDAIPFITGQLIITTHNTLLLDIPDIKKSVYIIKEDSNAERAIFRITEAGERIYQNNSLRARYLDGAYGGTPHIGDIDFVSLLHEE